MPIKEPINEIPKNKLDSIAKKLGEYFDEAGKSDYTYISTHSTDAFIYICVEHGNSRTMELVIENNKPKAVSHRPFSQDILRINRKTGEMIVHLEDELKKLLKKYKMYLGNIIVPLGEYSLYNKFDLSSLKKGKAAISLKELDDRISYVEVAYFRFKSIRKSGLISGIDCLEEAKRFGQENVTFTSADFRFTFKNPKIERRVVICDKNKAKIPLCPEYDIIEAFFIQNNFVDTTNYEKHLPLEQKS